ncbi:M23 family metallopeptidase [Staphylospora marina]|uniref:M23 family metallopeptidase n=1 Tax=Staphylospora marina TaxID=2490858 RepID=UPI0013DDC5C0|nr:M23 family metallopeptidase [Staphylospora marina]
MRHPTFLIATAGLTLMIVFLPPSNKAWLAKWEAVMNLGTEKTKSAGKQSSSPVAEDRSETPSEAEQAVPVSTQPAQKNRQELTAMRNGKDLYVKVDDLSKVLPVESHVFMPDGKIVLMHGEVRFEMFHEVPVVNRNGVFEPLNPAPVVKDGEAWVPVTFIKQVLNQTVTTSGTTVTLGSNPARLPSKAPGKHPGAIPAAKMVEILSFLRTPIDGAHVSTLDSHMPGAARTYRGGIHEGIDWYSYGTGVRIDRNTPVRSMADGVVVRADHEYREMATRERNRLLEIGKNNDGQTPEPILDKLRGRQVWIQYENGVMVRYCHLDRIVPEVKPGTRIKAGEIVGYVGNSGTSDGAKGTNQGLHLHLDILLYGEPFWKPYGMEERRWILETVFNRNNQANSRETE